MLFEKFESKSESGGIDLSRAHDQDCGAAIYLRVIGGPMLPLEARPALSHLFH